MLPGSLKKILNKRVPNYKLKAYVRMSELNPETWNNYVGVEVLAQLPRVYKDVCRTQAATLLAGTRKGEIWVNLKFPMDGGDPKYKLSPTDVYIKKVRIKSQ